MEIQSMSSICCKSYNKSASKQDSLQKKTKVRIFPKDNKKIIKIRTKSIIKPKNDLTTIPACNRTHHLESKPLRVSVKIMPNINTNIITNLKVLPSKPL